MVYARAIGGRGTLVNGECELPIDRTMQPQSRPASSVEFEELVNDLTADQSSKPSVLTKNFIRGVICGLFLSTIYWLLFAAAFMRLVR
jgi:hypothetical protein